MAMTYASAASCPPRGVGLPQPSSSKLTASTLEPQDVWVKEGTGFGGDEREYVKRQEKAACDLVQQVKRKKKQDTFSKLRNCWQTQ